MDEYSKPLSPAAWRLRTSPRLPSILLASVAALETGALILKAGRTRFWYDELLTLHLSALQPLGRLWEALQAGADGMPPGYYLFVRLARMLPGDPHVILRLPSIAGYLMALLGLYWFARKRFPAEAALSAAILLTLTPFRSYAVEARSYALLTGLLAISAVLWQHTGEKRLITLVFGAFLTMAVSCHHLAVPILSVFGIAELTWTRLFGRIRWGVWAACVAAAAPFFSGLPLLLNFSKTFGAHFWSRPVWGTLVSTYKDYLGLDPNLALVLLVLFAITSGLLPPRISRKGGDGTRECGFTLPEIVLVAGFLLYPALLVMLAKLLNSGYVSRYGWPAIFGLVLASIYLLRFARPAYGSVLAALAIGFLFQTAREFKTLPSTDERWTRLEQSCRAEPGLPVVIASGLAYLEAAYYAPPDFKGRLIEVADADLSARLTGADTTDQANLILARFIPLRVEAPATFEPAHRRFYLYAGGSYDWLTPYLIEKRYDLKLLSTGGGGSLYLATR